MKRDFLKKRVFALSWFLFFLNLLVLLGSLHWLFELLTHFRLQYAILSACLSAISFILTLPRTGFLQLLLFCANGYFLLPYLPHLDTKATHNKPRYRLLNFNINFKNQNLAEIKHFIRQVEADIVLLVEANENQLKTLNLQAAGGYPEAFTVSRDDGFSIGLFSKWPMTDASAMNFDKVVPSIYSKIQLGNQTLNFIGSHPLPPVGRDQAKRRNDQIKEMSNFVSRLDGSVLLAGDLNISSWSPFFSSFTDASLIDSRRKRGMHGSWPSFLPPPLRIAIDHVLHSSSIEVISRSLGPALGSDHLPVIVDFWPTPEQTPKFP